MIYEPTKEYTPSYIQLNTQSSDLEGPSIRLWHAEADLADCPPAGPVADDAHDDSPRSPTPDSDSPASGFIGPAPGVGIGSGTGASLGNGLSGPSSLLPQQGPEANAIASESDPDTPPESQDATPSGAPIMAPGALGGPSSIGPGEAAGGAADSRSQSDSSRRPRLGKLRPKLKERRQRLHRGSADQSALRGSTSGGIFDSAYSHALEDSMAFRTRRLRKRSREWTFPLASIRGVSIYKRDKRALFLYIAQNSDDFYLFFPSITACKACVHWKLSLPLIYVRIGYSVDLLT